jgi:hypothetical protein
VSGNPAPRFAEFLRKLALNSILSSHLPILRQFLNDAAYWHIVCATGSALGGDIMTSQEYRSKALECLESAPWIGDRNAKKALIDMALCWLRLADMHDANEGRASDMREVSARA